MAPAKKAKVTSSSTRSARSKSSKAKVSGATPASRANRQKASTAKVSESGKGVTKGSAKVTSSSGRKPAMPTSDPSRVGTGKATSTSVSLSLSKPKPKSPGLIGTRNPISQATKNRMAKAAPKPRFTVREAGPRSLLPNSKFPAKTGAKGAAAATLKSVGSQALKGAAKAGLKAAVKAAPAVLALNAGKVADGTLGKGKPIRSAPKPSKAPSSKEKATAADFGKSFKKARAAGSKVFMYRGKRYTTKRKDGK